MLYLLNCFFCLSFCWVYFLFLLLHCCSGCSLFLCGCRGCWVYFLFCCCAAVAGAACFCVLLVYDLLSLFPPSGIWLLWLLLLRRFSGCSLEFISSFWLWGFLLFFSKVLYLLWFEGFGCWDALGRLSYLFLWGFLLCRKACTFFGSKGLVVDFAPL